MSCSRSGFMPDSKISTAAKPRPKERISLATRDHLFRLGYSTLRMDELARKLGMSKKTLYSHFPGKDALIEAVILHFSREVRTAAATIRNDTNLAFTDKLRRFSIAMARRLGGIRPDALRDLNRCAPHLCRQLYRLRSKSIPHLFSSILRQGQAAGVVRRDLDRRFVVNFWCATMQGLLEPDRSESLRLTPRQVVGRALELLFAGVLTPAGRSQYANAGKNPGIFC